MELLLIRDCKWTGSCQGCLWKSVGHHKAMSGHRSGKAEEGQNFTLVLDDVYVDAPIIRDNFRNVRLILSGADITQYADNMRLTNRVCSVVAFNHAAYGSARAISEYYFGEYDRLYSDISTGNSRSFYRLRRTIKM